MEHVSIKDYIADDMWGHILMSGEAVRGCAMGTTCSTAAEKLDYCKGIMVTFPFMMLANFSRWYKEHVDPAMQDYAPFMDAALPPLQAEVFPQLEAYFNEEAPLPEAERGAILIPLLTDRIPKYVLGEFYAYFFGDSPEAGDIETFWAAVDPLLQLTARMLEAAYDTERPISLEVRGELFKYVGTRYPFYLLKRWYDWQFGQDVLDFPPPPPEDQAD